MVEDKISGKGVKVMTPEQMLQRLPIAIAQVKAGNNSKSLASEIRHILYSLYRAEKIQKSLRESNADPIAEMDTIFMNTKNSKTSDKNRFRLNLQEKKNLKMPHRHIAHSNLSI